MKKSILTAIILVISLTPIALAQSKPLNEHEHCSHEKVQDMRIAFVTSKLALTPKQSQEFWPVNNQYTADLLELGKQRREIMKSIKESDTNTDALNKWLKLEQAEVDVKNKYAQRLQKILPEDKIVKAFVVEERFKYHLLKNYHKK